MVKGGWEAPLEKNQLYSIHLQTIAYQPAKQEGEGWKNCSVKVDVSNSDQDYQKACKQDISQLGLCTSGGDYGYGAGEPCLLLKVNKVS